MRYRNMFYQVPFLLNKREIISIAFPLQTSTKNASSFGLNCAF